MMQEVEKTLEAEPDFDLKKHLEEVERALRETNMMIEQSQGEVTKLLQRNTAITSHLKQIQNQLSNTTVEEIKLTYESALDAQQRLFVMRGQLEKLQNEKTHLEKQKEIFANFQDHSPTSSYSKSPVKSALASVEMLVNAQESERQRLSRQMHDGPAQALSNFILQTEIAMRLLDVDPAQAREGLGSLKASAMTTFQKVRNFIFELRPMMLDDLGLIPTVRRYADSFKEQTGMDVNITITGTEKRIEPYLEVMVFRAIQELMGNVFRHSQATLLKINLDLTDETIRAIVDDNGKGFDADTLLQSNSLGLKLIRERVEMLGGTFEIESSAGKGTRVLLFLPLGK